jgi:putative hydrolase of the HAD superfamily
MDLIRERITGFVMRITGLDAEEARIVQRGWFEAHGASLPGLLREHDVSVEEFLIDIHDVPLDGIRPDPRLRAALARLPGRRFVFTNGSSGHAERVLEKLEIADLFGDVFHIESGDLIPKPDPRTFEAIVTRFNVDPTRTAFFEDTPRNLKPAADLGMTTVLIGPHALASQAPFVHHRAEHLTPFLESLSLAEPADHD